MEINITEFVSNEDPFKFSASKIEMGENAGSITWNNAKNQSKIAPLLTTEEELNALREYVKDFGAWEEEEIDEWSPQECNALFIQLISGDIRECGMDEVDIEEFNWEAYERDAENGSISGQIFLADDGQIYYQLSH